MKMRLMTLALLTALMGLFVVSPMSAGAAKPSASGGSLTVPVTGTVNGVLNITNFAVNSAGQLIANGTFTSGSTTVPVTGIPVAAAATPSATPGLCPILHLTLGPLDLDLLGLVVHLDQVVLNIDAQSGPGNLLGNLLCGIAGLLDPGSTSLLAGLLNQLLGTSLGSLLTGIPVVGTLLGTLNITGFSAQNGQLLANGTFTSGTVSAPVSVPVDRAASAAATGGACEILHLVLGPLDLNLLGLVVHLNQVVLDISAQPGAGNLLGNLLCTVAHLLDGNAASTALANLLNRILSLL